MVDSFLVWVWILTTWGRNALLRLLGPNVVEMDKVYKDAENFGAGYM